MNASVYQSKTPKFDFSLVDEEEFKEKVKNAHRNTVRMLLKVLAYQKQEELLPEKWEIEHILPQKWQNSFFPDNSEREVRDLIEHIGNKIPFEKKLNIIASNGYFAKKKESYQKSSITLVQDLAKDKSDWKLDEIRERDIRIADELINLLSSWGLNKISEEHMETRRFKIEIPTESTDNYINFLKMFQKVDSDEVRQQFLDI